jgi:hypothetical protein
VGRHGVTEAYGVDVVLMTGDAQDRLASFDVVDVDGVIAGAGYNFSAISGEAY